MIKRAGSGGLPFGSLSRPRRSPRGTCTWRAWRDGERGEEGEKRALVGGEVEGGAGGVGSSRAAVSFMLDRCVHGRSGDGAGWDAARGAWM